MRLGKLRQDQFAYEDQRVIDVVMQGHGELWAAIAERDAIYANAEATEDDYMRAAELEGVVAEYDATPPKRAPVPCCWARAFRWNNTMVR